MAARSSEDDQREAADEDYHWELVADAVDIMDTQKNYRRRWKYNDDTWSTTAEDGDEELYRGEGNPDGTVDENDADVSAATRAAFWSGVAHSRPGPRCSHKLARLACSLGRPDPRCSYGLAELVASTMQ